jgi:uncharacterized protein YbcV (DUF1398 family)
LSDFYNTHDVHSYKVINVDIFNFISGELIMYTPLRKSVSFQSARVISDSLKASFENKSTFPEHVQAVASVGVIFYQVDLSRSQAIYTFNNLLTHIEKFAPFEEKEEGLFSPEVVQEVISEIQKKLIDYSTFLKKIAAAGVISYEVDLNVKKVTYWGANQEAHVEMFSGVKPSVAIESVGHEQNQIKLSGL